MTTDLLQPTIRVRDHDLTVADAMDPCEYQIAEDSTVDRANDIFRSAHVTYLIVRDHDGRCAGLVTRTGLLPFLNRSWYTERTRVRDVLRLRGPFAWPSMALDVAARVMRIQRRNVWPVVDEDGYTVGVLTAARVRGLLVAAES